MHSQTFYLQQLHPGERFTSNGKTYTVSRHEDNMSEVYCLNEKKFYAFWIWTIVTLIREY